MENKYIQRAIDMRNHCRGRDFNVGCCSTCEIKGYCNRLLGSDIPVETTVFELAELIKKDNFDTLFRMGWRLKTTCANSGSTGGNCGLCPLIHECLKMDSHAIPCKMNIKDIVKLLTKYEEKKMKSRYIRVANAMRNICKNDGETSGCCLNCPIHDECMELGHKYIPYNMTQQQLSIILEFIDGGRK